MTGIKPGDTVTIRVHWGGFIFDIRRGVKVVSIDRQMRVTCSEQLWPGHMLWRVPIGNVIQEN